MLVFACTQVSAYYSRLLKASYARCLNLAINYKHLNTVPVHSDYSGLELLLLPTCIHKSIWIKLCVYFALVESLEWEKHKYLHELRVLRACRRVLDANRPGKPGFPGKRRDRHDLLRIRHFVIICSVAKQTSTTNAFLSPDAVVSAECTTVYIVYIIYWVWQIGDFALPRRYIREDTRPGLFSSSGSK